MSTFLPIIIKKYKVRDKDVGEIGTRTREADAFANEILNCRNRLFVKERYKLLRTTEEKRRVQELLLNFIESNGGRVLKNVPVRDEYSYVVLRPVACGVAYDGTNVTRRTGFNYN